MKATTPYLFTLLMLCMAFPVLAQRKNVRYVKITEFGHDTSILSVEFLSSKLDPLMQHDSTFNKSLHYHSGKIYKFEMDVRDEMGEFSMSYFPYEGDSSLRVLHYRRDTVLNQNFSINLKKVHDSGKIEATYTVMGWKESETEDENFTQQYALSQEVINHYLDWTKKHIDSVDLLVIPPWPDTKSCTQLEFAEFKRDLYLESGDTSLSYHYTTTTLDGVTKTDTSFMRMIQSTRPIGQGMTADISVYQNKYALSYTEVHYNDQMDSSFQYSYTISEGDTTHTTRMYTVLKSDTLYYKVKLKSTYGSSGQDQRFATREIYYRKDKTLRIVDVLAIGQNEQGQTLKQAAKLSYNHYPSWYEGLLPRKDFNVYQNTTGMFYYPVERKPLVEYRPPVVKQPKKQQRHNSRQSRRNRRLARIYRVKTKRVEIDRKRGYEKKVDKENPRIVYEIFF